MATAFTSAFERVVAQKEAGYPLTQFQPTPRQAAFIASVLGTQTYENFFLASNRAGKTLSGAMCGATLALEGLPDAEVRPAVSKGITVWDRSTSGWVLCVSYKALNEAVQPCYFLNGSKLPGVTPFIPAEYIAGWNKSEQILRLTNGSQIGFRTYIQPSSDVASVGKDWVHLDEEPPIGHYKEISLRVAAGRRLRLFGTCTLLPPEGTIGGVSWLYEDRIRPWLSGTRSFYALFSSSIYENPYLEGEEIERLEAIYPEGSLDRRIRLGGEWLPGIVGARVYTAYSDGLHIKPQRLHPRYPLAWCIDFNVQPFCTVIGQYYSGVFHYPAELVLDSGGIDDMCDLFRETYPSHQHEVWIYGDATGGSRSAQTGKTSYRLILENLQSYPQAVKLKVPQANPGIRDRINAVNYALRGPAGHVGIEIDPTCKELIADFNGVLSDGRQGIKKSYAMTDAYSRRTGTSDAAGYHIIREQPVPSRRRDRGGAPIKSTAPRYQTVGR